MKAIPILCVLILLYGCAPYEQYRTDYTPCPVTTERACETAALQRVTTGDGAAYSLNFIEFDDQGSLWDRRQLNEVMAALNAEAAEGNLLIVVFAHGWKHSADPADANIATFNQVLARLSRNEAYIAGLASDTTGTRVPPRRVAGVYLGWRGDSLRPIPLLEELTFWNRKKTAEKVGHGDVTEVLSRLEKIKRDKGSIGGDYDATRLVVVGHSFGGLVVHTALAQILANRFVVTTGPDGREGDIENFGDLVVLINPAFEAQLYASLRDMSTARGTYFGSQLPVLAILTSESDDATGVAFPAGRRVSTLFEKTRDVRRWNPVTKREEVIDQGAANVTAVGHFEPYQTHRLDPLPGATAGALETSELLDSAVAANTAWQHDAPGSRIPFGSVVLARGDNSAGRDPYLVIRVDRDIIPDHNDISRPAVSDFLTQLIMISTLSEAQKGVLLREYGAGYQSDN